MSQLDSVRSTPRPSHLLRLCQWMTRCELREHCLALPPQQSEPLSQCCLLKLEVPVRGVSLGWRETLEQNGAVAIKWLAHAGIIQEYHGAVGFLAVLPAPLPMKATPSRRTPAVEGPGERPKVRDTCHPEDSNRGPTKPRGAAITHPVKRKCSYHLPRPFLRSPSTGRERDRKSEKSEDSPSSHPGSWLRAGWCWENGQQWAPHQIQDLRL